MGKEPDPASWHVLEGLVRGRHSCRAFKKDTVPHETIMRILETAQQSVSDCNIQPWHVTIVGGSVLDRLREAMYQRSSAEAIPVWDIAPIQRYDGIYLERRRECGWSLYNSVGIERGDRVNSRRQALENFRFFGAPHLAIITTHSSLGARALFDCGGYVTLFVLTAHALGVASIPQASITFRVDVLREQLDIRADHQVVCGISFGYADEGHPANAFRTSRATVNEVVSFEQR